MTLESANCLATKKKCLLATKEVIAKETVYMFMSHQDAQQMPDLNLAQMPQRLVLCQNMDIFSSSLYFIPH
jgi:hypothetical protein